LASGLPAPPVSTESGHRINNYYIMSDLEYEPARRVSNANHRARLHATPTPKMVSVPITVIMWA